MSTQRTTKIYINDQDTIIGQSTKKAGTLSGYVYITTILDEEVPDQVAKCQYRITTTTPDTKVLNDWDSMFNGAVESYKKHYSKNYEGVSIKCGNIVQERNLQLGIMRDVNVACWVAAYDQNVIAFQIHYPSGAIFQSHDVAMSTNANGQRECDIVTATKTTFDPSIKMTVLKGGEKTHRREGSKLSFSDEAEILRCLQDKKAGKSKITGALLATQYQVSKMAISKLKSRFEAEGKL
jgi:hypothetical protein